jgi:ribonuclease HI
MARDLLNEVSKLNTINLKWIPREKNEYADNLSKRELLKHNIKITQR